MTGAGLARGVRSDAQDQLQYNEKKEKMIERAVEEATLFMSLHDDTVAARRK